MSIETSKTAITPSKKPHNQNTILSYTSNGNARISDSVFLENQIKSPKLMDKSQANKPFENLLCSNDKIQDQFDNVFKPVSYLFLEV